MKLFLSRKLNLNLNVSANLKIAQLRKLLMEMLFNKIIPITLLLTISPKVLSEYFFISTNIHICIIYPFKKIALSYLHIIIVLFYFSWYVFWWNEFFYLFLKSGISTWQPDGHEIFLLLLRNYYFFVMLWIFCSEIHFGMLMM